MNYMHVALNEAKKAFIENEVPVGAVIVYNNTVIASSHNKCETLNDNTAHAELLVIRKALSILSQKQLSECDLYVTVEPCAMCTGAIFNTKIKRIYIGCMEPKTGCLGSITDLSKMLPWNPEIYYGFCEDECKKLMKDFFESKRKSV